MQALRRQELTKSPGVAETLDWAVALQHLNAQALSAETVQATLGIILESIKTTSTSCAARWPPSC